MRYAVRDVDLGKHRLQVRVNHEGHHRDELPVRELEWRPKLWKNVHVRDEVLARVKLPVAIDRILCFKETEAQLTPEVAVCMLGDVSHKSGKVFDQLEVAFSVKKIDFCLAHWVQ